MYNIMMGRVYTKQNSVTTILLAVIVAALIAAATVLPTMITSVNAQDMTSAVQTATNVTIQKTATSTVDELPGHQMHQAAVVLPQRADGKIWVGTISWSASKPVEVRLLQNYNTSITPDAAHGKPVTAPFANGESAISLLLASNGAATVPSYYSGSMNFAASQVAFHTLGGLPFTVTYTIDAAAKTPTS